jgi:hypothetical protein
VGSACVRLSGDRPEQERRLLTHRRYVPNTAPPDAGTSASSSSSSPGADGEPVHEEHLRAALIDAVAGTVRQPRTQVSQARTGVG